MLILQVQGIFEGLRFQSLILLGLPVRVILVAGQLELLDSGICKSSIELRTVETINNTSSGTDLAHGTLLVRKVNGDFIHLPQIYLLSSSHPCK